MDREQAEIDAAAERLWLLKDAKNTQDEYQIYRTVRGDRIGGLDYQELNRRQNIDRRTICDAYLALRDSHTRLVAALRACAIEKPGSRPCWCFQWKGVPCVDEPQCVAAPAALTGEG